MKKVGVKIWSIDSDPGYRPSNGSASVVLVPREKEQELAAAASEGNRALYEFVRRAGVSFVEKRDLIDVEPYERRYGVCNYSGVTGVLEYDDSAVIPVAIEREDICTSDHVYYRAEVLDGDSLRKLYQDRAEKYARLATEVAS